jgi:hypothetical protein
MAFEASQIREGSEIFTRDGEKIGAVKQVSDGYFKVNAHMQPDYWLPLGSVDSCTAARVTMAFDKNDLGEHKANLPGDEELPRPDGDRGLASQTGPNTQSELTSLDDRELPPSQRPPGS